MKKPSSLRIVILIAVLLLVALEAAGRIVRTESPYFPVAETATTRLIGAMAFILLIRRMGYPVLGAGRLAGKGKEKPPLTRQEKWFLALSLLVAVNNFPWIGILSGRAKIVAEPALVACFALECAAVGCFEELAFRGFLLPYCFDLVKDRKRPAFLAALLSSSVFALVHLVNLFSGASPAAVLMQIGYSFLVGGMCACVLFAAGSVWACALLHAVYNFCGTLLSRYGEGIRWDPATIACTALLGGIAAAAGFRTLLNQTETL